MNQKEYRHRRYKEDFKPTYYDKPHSAGQDI